MMNKQIKILIAGLSVVAIATAGGVFMGNLGGENNKKVEIEKENVEENQDKVEDSKLDELVEDTKVEDEKKDEETNIEVDAEVEENKEQDIEIDKETPSEGNKPSEENKPTDEVEESLKVTYLNKLNEANEKIQTIKNESAADANSETPVVMIAYAEKQFNVWDAQLNAIWAELGKSMEASEFETLRAEQMGWLDAYKKWEADLVENEGFQNEQKLKAMVYKTERTKERCFELVNKYM